MEFETYNIYIIGERTVARDVSFDEMIRIVKDMCRSEFHSVDLDIRIERRWRPMTEEEVKNWM